MRAHVGDHIVLAGEHVDQPTRDGLVKEVRGQDGEPPFLIEWSDGHTGLVYPGPGSVLRITGSEEPGSPDPHRPATAGGTTTGRMHEWTVRVSIFESGDDTRATAVLLSDSPRQLTARGESHRSPDDEPVPEIGDEVAVARALRHLAERLVATAESDIEDLTGKEARVRPR
jgi:Domain of unknown function (DUF1876)/Domain of unknown function (DUF1918)